MERARITGEGPDGHEHVVRVVSRRRRHERVVCDTCGYSRWSLIDAGGKAERHLTESHEVEDARWEHSPQWWLGVAIGLVVFVAFLFSPYGFFH
ncbi:hypothetical protein ACFVHB_33800 [Kitasatospora sp. NPDC127111]|uniref:hypothetical protein n=1 Tax=Kitasatospora sp. NPDC127111 TaxID=3345363 RepID=UPI003641384E